MGMAASQARLLSITTRMSDNELRSQLINNSKMRLATESSQVSENYINALNDAQYMFTNYDENNKATYQQLTFNSLTAYNEYNNQYGISNAAGQILVSERDAKRFEEADGSLENFLAAYGLEYKTSYFEELEEQFGTQTIKLDTVKNLDGTTTTNYSRYNIQELQAIYEGNQDAGGTHAGYDNSLMTQSFNSYLKLEEKYLKAEENYYSIIEEIMLDYAKGVSANGVSYETILNYINSGTSDGNAVSYFYAFEAIINNMEAAGKFSKAAVFEYEEANGNVLKLDFPSYMQKLIDDMKYVNDTYKDSETSCTYNGNVALISLDGDYYVEVTQTETAPDTYSYSYRLLEQDEETGAYIDAVQYDEDGSKIFDYDPNNKLVTFYEEGAPVFSYKYNFNGDSSWGKNTITYRETLLGDKNATYFGNLGLLVSYFNDVMVNAFDGAQFASVAASNPEYSQYYNEYADAARALSNFIFGTDVGFSNYTYLSDYNWCLDRGGTKADYQSVSDVLAIEELFAVYGEPKYAYIKDGDPDSNGDAEAKWYTNLFERMTQGYKAIENGLASSADWIKYALESGLVKMEQVDKDQKWNSITYSSCSDITEQTNDTAVAIAEAEYQKAMNKIENKDKVYDMELKNIDTEHTALQTEYDSIKSALDKNVERNFKLYS